VSEAFVRALPSYLNPTPNQPAIPLISNPI